MQTILKVGIIILDIIVLERNWDKKMKKLWQDFKAFITRGNVLDLAVGVIIGGAFAKIVDALTSSP